MPIKSLKNEKDILKEVAAGSQKAFTELFNAYHNQLGEYILMLTASEEMAEEIILDIFVKIWMNRLDLTHIENFSSYIFILTRNYTLNCIRKTVNDRKKQDIYILHLGKEEPYSVSGLGDDEKDYTEIVEKAVAQLPPQQQKVFILKREGKKNSDIAAELQISSESVRKYYQWAVKSVSGYVKSHIEVSILLAYVGIFCK
ncbi:MAG: hypothetical protein JWR50_2006 [Mucilaginibacter sp.]|nr:hypothetical protein [Mucilaginibacter sp.]